MNIIVCCKQVIDPEAPPASFKVDANKVLPPAGVPPVISPFDEGAVEAALRLKDAKGGKVTVISLGTNLLRDVVKKPLSMGADELILLEDPVFTDVDSYSVAYALSLAIKKIGQYDMILCGRQAADWDSGQTGSGIAEILGLPSVTVAKKIEITADNKARIERVVSDGVEVIEAGMPILVTVSNEIGAPRYPTMKGIMAAKKKEPIVWKPADIGAEPARLARRTKLVKLFQPVKEGKVELIGGQTPEEAGANLAMKLREIKVL